MKVIWLGQNGFLFVSGKNKVLVDPYLSDSLKELDVRMERGWSINKRFLEVEPDVIVLTNSHMDHTDITTLRSYIERNKYQTTLLCCESAFNIISSSGIIGRYNNVLMEAGSQWTHDNLMFEAVPAKTDDKTAIGIVITDSIENKKYYITSDTLYNSRIFRHIPGGIDTLFLPINGEDGGMNMDDAVRFAKEIDAAHTVPVHFGMFDDVNPKRFKVEGAVIPEIYRIIPLSGQDVEGKRMSLRKVLANEEREMKMRLSQRELKVENSKIVSEPSPSDEEITASPKAEPESITENKSVKEGEPIKTVYDPLPAREAGLSYLQALKERQKAKEGVKKNAPLQEIKPHTDKKEEIIETKAEENTEELKPTETVVPKAEEIGKAVFFTEAREETPPTVKEESVPVEVITEENLDFTGEEDISFVESFTVAGASEKEAEAEGAPSAVAEPDTELNSEVRYEPEEEISAELSEEDSDEEGEKNAPWGFDPFSTEGFEGTFEVDSARGALAFETLESIQEITEDYDNVEDEEEIPEPYDDGEEEELQYMDTVEISEGVDEAEEYTESEEADTDAEEDEVDADEELIYSDITDEDEKPSYEVATEDEKSSKAKSNDESLTGFEAFDESDDEDMSDKIDAYIKELEKFERGDTVDFSKLEF